jgi:hypothetical protein
MVTLMEGPEEDSTATWAILINYEVVQLGTGLPGVRQDTTLASLRLRKQNGNDGSTVCLRDSIPKRKTQCMSL